MLLLNLILLIDVTFSTPTPVNNKHADYNGTMRKASCFWYASVVGLILASGAASAQVCPPDGASNDALIAFLQTARTRNSAHLCVVNAIKQLQYAHSQKAVDVLIKHLDFRPRLGISEAVVTGSNLEEYPAVSSLFSIGRLALPALLHVVVDNGYTKTAQDNAVRTIMMINRDRPADGITLMMKEARNSDDVTRRELFSQAAMSALRWCVGEDQKECESALSDARNP
jgi:hypothetical protein